MAKSAKKSPAKSRGKSRNNKVQINDEDAIKFVLNGNVGSGKTTLVKKFFNPSVEINASETDTSHYWYAQMENVETVYSYKNVNFKFVEVPESRGRSSNYYLAKEAMKNADAVIHCENLHNTWKATADQLANYVKHAHNQVKHFCEESKDKTVPFFCFGTFADDKKVDSDTFASILKKDGVTYYEVSSLTNQGIQEAFTDVLDNILYNTDKGRKLLQSVTTVPEPQPISANTTTTTIVEPTMTTQKKNIVTKILSLFGLASESQPSSVEKLQPKPVAELMVQLNSVSVDQTVTAPSA